MKIGAEGADEEQLHELALWAEKHSPIGDAVSRPVPMRMSVELVQ